MRAMRVAPAVLALLALGAGCRERQPAPDASRPAPPGAGPPAPPPTAPSGSSHASPPAGQVRLAATNAAGVPVHAAKGDSAVSRRLPDGASVRVVGRADDGRWLEIATPDGARGWITRRYVAAPSPRALPRAGPADSLPPAWRSADACLAELRAGHRAPRGPGVARVASWNLHWFPDGRPGKTNRPGEGTDVAWLACAIAWMGADVVAVQEVKRYAAARDRAAELLRDLDADTGGAWRLELDRCPDDTSQHVGLLYDSKRVVASNWRMVAVLNPQGEACKDHLRPGFGASLRWPGGLDLSMIAVHLKSGPKQRDIELRRRSLAAFDQAYRDARDASHDDDVLFAGDFNTMGCERCSPPVTSESEIAGLPLPAALRRVDAAGACSEYYDGKGDLLDHFVAARRMLELPDDARSRVSGFCASEACRRLPRTHMPAAYARLSDHCPVVLDLSDRDRD